MFSGFISQFGQALIWFTTRDSLGAAVNDLVLTRWSQVVH